MLQSDRAIQSRSLPGCPSVVMVQSSAASACRSVEGSVLEEVGDDGTVASSIDRAWKRRGPPGEEVFDRRASRARVIYFF